MGALIGSSLGPWVGILAGMVTGGLLALGLAVLAIRYRVDQIIAGVVINIFALGLTSFLTSQILVRNPELNDVRILAPYKIPLLGDIPVIGPVLFDHNFFVYAMFVLVGVMSFGLFRTRWGLRSRAVGEHPKAADTVGINVFQLRYWNVMLGGLIAGMGGAFFTIGSAGFRRKHVRRSWLHWSGGDDLRALAPGWRLGCRPGVRIRRLAAEQAGDPADAHPRRVLADGALYRHDDRGGRPGRQGPTPRRRRPAVREGVARFARSCQSGGPRGLPFSFQFLAASPF